MYNNYDMYVIKSIENNNCGPYPVSWCGERTLVVSYVLSVTLWCGERTFVVSYVSYIKIVYEYRVPCTMMMHELCYKQHSHLHVLVVYVV